MAHRRRGRRGGKGVTVRIGRHARAMAARARAFVEDTRAGATAIAAAAVTVMTVGASALIIDHVWLVDQRDVLKTAADAAAIAATLEIDRRLAADPDISDEDLKAALLPAAARYVFMNLLYLPEERLERAARTLEVAITDLDRDQRTVEVSAQADLGGTLFSRALPLLGNYKGPVRTVVKAGVESQPVPVELVLSFDLSSHMIYRLDGTYSGYRSPSSRLAIVRQAAKNVVAILKPNRHERVAVGLVLWTNQVRLDDGQVKTWADKGWSMVVPGTNPLPQSGEACFAGRRVYAGTPAAPSATPESLFALPGTAPFAKVLCRGKFSGSLDFLPPMLPLSNERTVIENHLDALYPFPEGKRSDSALGVLWAQRMLDPAWRGVWGGSIHPVDPSVPRYAKLRKAIILFTSTDDRPQGISRAEACTAAKSQGTELFVIAAMTPSEASGTLGQALRDCSSENDRAYPAGTRRPGGTYVFLDNATPAKLMAAFADIANQISTPRKVL